MIEHLLLIVNTFLGGTICCYLLLGGLAFLLVVREIGRKVTLADFEPPEEKKPEEETYGR